MFDNLEIELILTRKKYKKIYNAIYITLIITITTIVILCNLKFNTYYITYGKIVDNKLVLSIKLDYEKYIVMRKYLIIEDKKYYYSIDSISNELYIDNNYNNYHQVYLKVNGLEKTNNLTYKIKILKSSKTIANYLKELL